MTRTKTTTDAAGYQHHTYTNGADYSIGQLVASADQTAAGWSVTLGWYERNGWNNSLEFVVAYNQPRTTYKTLAAAEKRIAKHIAA